MKKLNKKIMTLMAGAFIALGISSCSQYDDVGPVQEAPKAEFVMPENAVVLAEQSRNSHSRDGYEHQEGGLGMGTFNWWYSFGKAKLV